MFQSPFSVAQTFLSVCITQTQTRMSVPLKILLYYIVLFYPASSLHSQTFQSRGADTVISVRWGTGQDFGRTNFPANVLGLPDTLARSERPSNNPAQVCSLGMGGEVVLGWKNAVLVNRPGADFTVFENAFINFTGRAFAEPAKIAVSRDGVRFVEFPFDSLTLKGCAGVTPVNGNQSPFNPQLSGGDSFDLASIGMDSVRFIKITDISAMVLSNPRHPFYDPTITGFDLDAIVGLSLVSQQRVTSVALQKNRNITVKNHNDFCTIELPEPTMNAVCTLYNVQGAQTLTFTAHEQTSFSTAHLARGAYFLVVRAGTDIFTKSCLLR